MTRSTLKALVCLPGLVACSWAGRGLCGIGTNMLDDGEAGMDTFCGTHLDFWWNWAYVPRRAYTAACARSKFVPMFWGMQKDDAAIALDIGLNFSCFNEPDHWGPPAYPGGDTLSAGTSPDYFHCSNPVLAQHWQMIVSNFKKSNPQGTVLSPAMADAGSAASTGDFASCNGSPQIPPNHMDDCLGWLKGFKQAVMQLPCGSTNCWDAIDVLQFHAYFYSASDFIAKVKQWESAWADDLQGTGGRSKKTLWITEFAHAGTTDPADPDGAGRAFMEEAVQYLQSSPYVSGWSWFSQDNTTFASFPIGGVTPKAAFWDSSLISKAGEVTELGKKYFSLCSSAESDLRAPALLTV
eukprot:CAMPEP_0178424986 /NCGR_PEP_ID=MMETSP0689_2-20121128/28492_1 /TAXON_ID=160604 /ORGANISM="Amphidinium massartii, Strain CS-259" /LENGTH=351 /DNA_ID=CAMNT_0020046639 /DNA_START=35 /DNA_END=1090 /DNA_ORIENTATION=-